MYLQLFSQSVPYTDNVHAISQALRFSQMPFQKVKVLCQVCKNFRSVFLIILIKPVLHCMLNHWHLAWPPMLPCQYGVTLIWNTTGDKRVVFHSCSSPLCWTSSSKTHKQTGINVLSAELALVSSALAVSEQELGIEQRWSNAVQWTLPPKKSQSSYKYE